MLATKLLCVNEMACSLYACVCGGGGGWGAGENPPKYSVNEKE